jgi:hypothetical protein
MPTYEAARELLAPRADVWAFLSEPYNLPDWWPGIGGLQPDRRGFAPGARWQVVGENRPSLFRKPNMSGMLLVIVVEPYERFAFQLTGRFPRKRSTVCTGSCKRRQTCRRMFDLRYHVASLAAVFVALIVGILVGVGLAGSGVNQADLTLARDQRDRALDAANTFKEQRDQLQRAADAFERAYPVIMRDLLVGRRVAVLFVGSKDGGVNQAIDNTLTDAGADPSVRVVSLSVPIDAQNLNTALFAKGPQFVKYVGNDKLEGLGNELGAEFASGGQTPLWKVLGKQLIGERNGNLRQTVDGVVLVRTVSAQQGDTARFLRGFYGGLASAGIPVVGVEKSNSKMSAVGVFQDRGLSTVDDIDLSMGRAALALLLAGAAPGKYGTRDVAGDAQNNADAVLPTFPSG